MPCTIAIALIATAPAAPVPKVPPESVYFPTQVGTKMVYVEGTLEMTVVVKSVEDKSGVKVVTTAQVIGDGKEQPGATYAVSEGGLTELSSGTPKTDLRLPFLRPPLTSGRGWEFNSAATGVFTGVRGAMTVLGKEEVTVPAGTYTAVPVQFVGTSGGRPGRTTYWYAPNVGLVRMVTTKTETDGTRPVVTERVLKSHIPGK